MGYDQFRGYKPFSRKRLVFLFWKPNSVVTEETLNESYLCPWFIWKSRDEYVLWSMTNDTITILGNETISVKCPLVILYLWLKKLPYYSRLLHHIHEVFFQSTVKYVGWKYEWGSFLGKCASNCQHPSHLLLRDIHRTLDRFSKTFQRGWTWECKCLSTLLFTFSRTFLFQAPSESPCRVSEWTLSKNTAGKFHGEISTDVKLEEKKYIPKSQNWTVQ